MPTSTSHYAVPRPGKPAACLVLVLLIIQIIFPGSLRAQLPAWVAANSITTSNQYSFFTSTSAIDANGDVVVVGNFQGDITFGTLPTLTAGSFSDVYVAKLNGQTRQWLWAVRGGGNGSNSSVRVSPYKVVIDGSGNILLAGSYRDMAMFAGLPTLVSSGGAYTARVLVAKLSGSTGTWLWATSTSGPSFASTEATSLALDAAGNAVVGGYFIQAAQFGSLPPVTATSTAAYVASIDASTGQWQWVKQLPSLTTAAVADVAVDAAGNVALAGYYQGSLTLGSLPTLLGSSTHNLFVAKLAPSTNQWLWAAGAVGTTSASATSYATSLKVSPTGDLLVAGSLASGSFQFGSLAAVAGAATYLAKLTGSAGTWQWVQSSANVSDYNVIAFDATGDILTAGAFTNTAQFGPAVRLTSRGDQDIFVSKTNAASGQAVWATRAGGTGTELVHALAATGTGDLLVTGTFQNQTDFGSLPTVAGTALASGVASTYLARLSLSSFAVADFSPTRNAFAASVAGQVDVVYTKPLVTPSPPFIRVFGDQRQGYKPGVSSQQSARGIANNALRFTPATPFSPNELVNVTVGSAVSGAGGAPAPAWVYQFRAAAGGPGRGLFSGTATIAGAWQSNLLTKGDVDNDGDLDFISAGMGGSTLTAGLNNGTGQFAAAPGLVAKGAITAVALADVDADGDLDLAWSAHYPTADSVLFGFNNGSGSFSGFTKVAVEAAPRSLAFGDLDADGDLDLVVSSYQTTGRVSLRLNDGLGHFSGTATVRTGTTTYGVALGDLDNDGDLDLLATNEGDNTISVALNDGMGSFGPAAATSAGALPHEVVLVDVDKDGDLDVVASSAQAGATSLVIGFNRGTGSFATSFPSVGSVSGFSLADIDADGDADLLILDQTAHTIRAWLNNGGGIFSRTQITTISPVPMALALADLDGDGDIDWLTANGDGTLSPRFNTGIALATQSSQAMLAVSVYPNPAHQELTIQLPAGTGATQLTLINSLGQEIVKRAAITPAPDNSIQLTIGDVAPGIYHLLIQASGLGVSKTLVID